MEQVVEIPTSAWPTGIAWISGNLQEACLQRFFTSVGTLARRTTAPSRHLLLRRYSNVLLSETSCSGKCASSVSRGRAGVEKAAATEEAYAGPTAAALQAVALLTAPGGRFVAKTRGLRCGGNPMWLSPSSSIPHRRPPEPRQRSPEQHVPAGLHRRNPQQRRPISIPAPSRAHLRSSR